MRILDHIREGGREVRALAQFAITKPAKVAVTLTQVDTTELDNGKLHKLSGSLRADVLGVDLSWRFMGLELLVSPSTVKLRKTGGLDNDVARLFRAFAMNSKQLRDAPRKG